MGIAVSRARSLPRASSRASSRASHRTASLPRAASRASIISSSRGSGIISGSALAQPRLSPHAPCSSLAHRHRALTRASSHLRLYPVSGSATASWAPLLSLGLCCHPSGSVASRFYHSPTRLSPLRLCCRLPGLSIASLACLLPLGLGYHFSRVATVPRAPACLSSMATSPRALAWLSLFEYGYRFSFRLSGSALAFRARLSLLSPLRPGYRLLGSATASRAPLSLLGLGSRLLGSTIAHCLGRRPFEHRLGHSRGRHFHHHLLAMGQATPTVRICVSGLLPRRQSHHDRTIYRCRYMAPPAPTGPPNFG